MNGHAPDRLRRVSAFCRWVLARYYVAAGMVDIVIPDRMANIHGKSRDSRLAPQMANLDNLPTGNTPLGKLLEPPPGAHNAPRAAGGASFPVFQTTRGVGNGRAGNSIVLILPSEAVLNCCPCPQSYPNTQVVLLDMKSDWPCQAWTPKPEPHGRGYAR